jgi:ABC-type polysaccharide/polyol phosphate export permease
VGAAVFLHHASPVLALLPLFMLLVGLFAVGIGWIAAALQVYLRDTAQVLAVVLTLWFWATPILLSEEKLNKFPPWSLVVIRANPMTYIVSGYRDLLLGHAVSVRDVTFTAAFGVTAFICGGLIFRYMKRGFADVL